MPSQRRCRQHGRTWRRTMGLYLRLLVQVQRRNPRRCSGRLSHKLLLSVEENNNIQFRSPRPIGMGLTTSGMGLPQTWWWP